MKSSASAKNTTNALVGYRLVVSYAGTSFYGWQRQEGFPTVQGEIERVIAIMWGRHISVEGSGRTDAGVHGYGQVVSFQAELRHRPEVLIRAMNSHLPLTVRVVDVKKVSSKFHARFDARAKTYEYRIWNRPVLDPLLIDRAWHIPLPLDLTKMRRAADLLEGTHDFASFATNPGYKLQSTVRTVYKIELIHRRGLLTVRMTANGFLHRMVRNVTGTLVRIAQGRLEIEKLPGIINSKNRTSAPAAAPAYGLYLMKVYYGAPYPPHDPRVSLFTESQV